ncbi:MAG: Rne/Rng family ribonuclease [Deferribacteraceae bacterium]|jgi:ribonuclease G|nr:Rne/Rng family ribonuclease [Deferribacteraceae bacterium]
MPKVILINSAPHEVRAAVLSAGTVHELFIERSRKRTVVGNIYKGKVVKVLPGMQSAFVDIGLQKAAFLHVADMLDDRDFDEESGDNASSEELNDTIELEELPLPPIEAMITEGQEIIVQVAKDAIGSKGARLTMHLSIPGRHIVLMPGYPHIGVSRKIESGEDRDKLREILREIRPQEDGLIARTVSKGQSRDDLEADRDYLMRIWRKVRERAEENKAPQLIYEDDNLIFRILRDVVTDDTSEIIIDSQQDYDDMTVFCSDYHPNLINKINLYTDDMPLFDAYNVEIEINRVLDKKIWLRSGGYIIIDQAEALTVIDVNTGKFVGKRNFEETIFKTNIEAAREIAHQLRLRNIGGIVIVDFIDMEAVANRSKVLSLLDELLREDRARASVMNITPLGLVEITRKRSQESFIRLMSEACPYCEGRGVIKSRLTICYDILRQIRRIAPDIKLAGKGKKILLEAHNEIADILLSNERESIDALEQDYNVKIEIKFRPNFHLEHYELIPLE